MIDFLFTKTPLAYFVQSLWRDEAFTYLLTQESIIKILNLSAKDFTPPLHALLLKFWIWIFGTTEVALRSLSLVFYIISAYFFYLFLTKILRIKTIWKYLYLTLFLFNPVLNYFAFESRTYSLLFLVSLASFYFLLRKKYIHYFITLGIGLYTHYFMLLIMGCQIIYILFTEKKPFNVFKKMTISILVFTPWILYVISQNKLINEPFWINSLSKESLRLIPAILYSGYESGYYYLNEIVANLNLTIFLYIFAGLYLYIKGEIKNKKLFFVLLLWGFLPSFIALAVSTYKPVFLSRYLIISTFGILLYLIFINEKLNKIVKYILFGILLLQTFNYSMIQIENRAKPPYKKIFSEIKNQSNKNDLVYVESELDYHVAKYYFDPKRVFIYNKNYKDIPNFVGKVLIPKGSIKSTIPKYPTKAFILYSNLSYDIKTVF